MMLTVKENGWDGNDDTEEAAHSGHSPAPSSTPSPSPQPSVQLRYLMHFSTASWAGVSVFVFPSIYSFFVFVANAIQVQYKKHRETLMQNV